ncbi:AI-2E family transporter [Uruburuella testudinis]|uniref:AI-2E family transporter n=1 Tax=Uruburuella testudinis TaxID=1282863 RepID=A0ABY4DVK0_9NEIS|nr:AI-2E family transporter [Uruburuella testudinis]UOO83050.1 AI-2E family transporter [Uruburuella testudinis]
MNTREKLSFTTFPAAIAGVLLLWLPVLLLHLTIALFTALITCTATRWLAHHLRRSRPGVRHAELSALLLFVLLSAAAIYLAGHWLHNQAGGNIISSLMTQTAGVLDRLHTQLPASLSRYLPASAEGLRDALSQGLKDHALQLQTAGTHTLSAIGHALAGLIIGGLMAVQMPTGMPRPAAPLSARLHDAFQSLCNSFSEVFFAQVRISLINTALTAIYLLGILPLLGKPLPMSGALVALTFFSGLIPVVGNLISNAFIVVLSLSDSVTVTVMSLLWLIGIHKLEYFLNAHIIGQKIKAAAWELLLAMLLMEAMFGLAGLVSAPIIYAQIKHILIEKGWIGRPAVADSAAK